MKKFKVENFKVENGVNFFKISDKYKVFFLIKTIKNKIYCLLVEVFAKEKHCRIISGWASTPLSSGIYASGIYSYLHLKFNQFI